MAASSSTDNTRSASRRMTKPLATLPMVIGENAEEDARRFYRSEEGIVLVTREMLRKLQIKQER